MKSKFILFSFLACLALGVLGFFYPETLWTFAIVGPVILIGLKDVIQTKHILIRNFPVVGNMLWVAEWMLPKVYKYLG